MAERFEIEVKNRELGKHRVISGTNYDVVAARARALTDAWNAEWDTQLAKIKLDEIRNILWSAVRSKPVIDWRKIAAEYPVPKPAYPTTIECPPKPQTNSPAEPVYLEYPDRPANYLKDWQTVAEWDEACKQVKAENLRRHHEYKAALEKWHTRNIGKEIANWNESFKQAEAENLRRHNKHTIALEEWNTSRSEYEKKRPLN